MVYLHVPLFQILGHSSTSMLQLSKSAINIEVVEEIVSWFPEEFRVIISVNCEIFVALFSF